MPTAFLALYTTFFVFTGVNQLAMDTLQGKLIQPTHRGRLLMMSSVVGGILAITCAWYFLRGWLYLEDGEFQLVFGFAGGCFVLAALSSLWMAEPTDHFRETHGAIANQIRKAVGVFQRDANFRPLALVASLHGTSIMLFPHYQALGRDRLDLSLDHLMWWLIVQNVGTVVFSLVAGPLADRHGNRLVLRLAMLGTSGIPILALALAHSGHYGNWLFVSVFFFVGLTPIAIRILNNYTLEICGPGEHPRYLSTLNACLAVPMFLSPLVGWLVELTSFEVVFLGVAMLVFLGFSMTFILSEPRHHDHRSAEVPPKVEDS